MIFKMGRKLRVVLAAAGGALLLGLAVVLFYPGNAREAMDRGYYALARGYLVERAQAGEAKAQNALANLYYLGLGGKKDHVQAVRWYLKSAAQSYSPAQVNVARMYRLGLGVKRDVIRSFGWLLHARANGNERAEVWMRAVVSGVAIPPNQVIFAREHYRTLDALLSGARSSP